ncbi:MULTISPECIES: Holliday junction resolvase RuvX [Pseudarthrobacter]|uniref:Putative pre-16S rRNA nuclease n=1 Tax=Pseudarthrobacter polychromogenes TaxID=1676 RepID=A0ABQ1X9V8_9MICC|nr:Holliday junction resolvase RuvX [Pseudarthrobacter polychromogenes]MBD1536952.1 Holliday junction resolvase RuvX [Arthrobacter sp. S13_S34]MBD1592294.1 Holliday junction resolvase RuvX [Arthrobacter sp. S1_S22]GGG85326.1 putative pre-16S rRNA nuclease [Pseudarthrobacter polychromogenes]
MTDPAAAGDYPHGIKLGVDVGTVRVGVAICDRESILATPYKTLDRNAKKNSDVRVIAKLVQELGAVQVFVGLPRTMKGEERASAMMATDYAHLLVGELAARDLAVPVNLVDERLSSVSAHRSLHEAGMSSRNHRKVVDQVAAAGILQHAIDMQKARGADVGSRVTAPPPSVDMGGSAPETMPATPGDTDRSSDNGRHQ